jgi:signal transduction histidine kinase
LSTTSPCFLIRVTDTGSGIDPASLDKVTQPHVRGKGSQGFGLGLSIVQRLSERFGLKLIIESAPDEGTTVQLWFNSGFHKSVPIHTFGDPAGGQTF